MSDDENADQAFPWGTAWIANYGLNIEVKDRPPIFETSPEVLSVRVREVGEFFYALIRVGEEPALYFETNSSSAVSIARFLRQAPATPGSDLTTGAEVEEFPAEPRHVERVIADPSDSRSNSGSVWATTWEYCSIKKSSMNLDGLVAELNTLGRQAWELVNFDTADRTLGTNVYVALLRRPTGQVPIVW